MAEPLNEPLLISFLFEALEIFIIDWHSPLRQHITSLFELLLTEESFVPKLLERKLLKTIIVVRKLEEKIEILRDFQ